MPQKVSARPNSESGPRTPSTTRTPRTTATRARWGFFGLFVCILAFVVAGCASTATTSPVGAGTPLVATSDASQDAAAPETSAFPSTDPASTTPPATSEAPQPVPTTHAAAPKPVTTTANTKPSLCGAPPNPFGYNFCGRGGYIYGANPAKVCSYFDCIANFGNSPGYMIECKDGTYSTAGGRSGACSDHGGKLQAVYSG